MPRDASNASCFQVKPAKVNRLVILNISMRFKGEQSQCHGESGEPRKSHRLAQRNRKLK